MERKVRKSILSVPKLTLDFFASDNKAKENKTLQSNETRQLKEGTRIRAVLTAIIDAGTVNHSNVDQVWKGYPVVTSSAGCRCERRIPAYQSPTINHCNHPKMRRVTE